MVKKERKTLKFKENELFLKVGQYRSNDNLAITAYMEEEPYADITINLPGFFLDSDTAFINELTKDSGLEKKLIKEGVIKEVVGTVKYNYGTYEQVIFNMKKLKEYDPKGVEEYENLIKEQKDDLEEEE